MRKTLTILILTAFALTLISMAPRQARAQGVSTVSIINPGPASYPTKWNASAPLAADLATGNFSFFAPQTTVGSTFFVNLTVSGVSTMNGWAVGVVYDNTTLTFISAWRPTDHCFAPAVAGGATPIPVPIIVDSIDSTHQIIEWGFTFVWTDTQGNPVIWTFNGTGTMCQLEFQLIKPVSASATQWTSMLTLNSDWTTVYRTDLPSGRETPNFATATVKYVFLSGGPTIANPTQVPSENIMNTDSVLVSTSLTDTGGGIGAVTLMYSTDNGATWNNVTMTYNSTSGNYSATIPPQAAGTQVKYKIQAYDLAGNSSTNDNSGSYYAYPIIPEFETLLMLLAFAVTSFAALLATKKVRRH